VATRNFNHLAAESKKTWSPEAVAVYEAVGASYDAEIAARADLGAMLAAARAERRMTQPELAMASGVQQADISRIESGRANPTIGTLTRLVNALGKRLTIA